MKVETVNDLIDSNNNKILSEIITQLEKIIKDKSSDSKNIIKQINSLITLLKNKMDKIDDQFNSMRDEMKSMENNIINKIKECINGEFKEISNNKNDIKISGQDISKFINEELLDKIRQQISSTIYLNNNCSLKKKIFDFGKYEGEFKNDKIEGKGTFYYDNGNKYEGEFKNEKIEGKGIFYSNNGYRYEGEFRNGIREGKGKEFYNNGDIYEGDFKNDVREGKGIYYYNSGEWEGDIYEGEWKNDKKNGKGIYYYHNGTREMGDYSNGKRIGTHVSLDKNGSVKKKPY